GYTIAIAIWSLGGMMHAGVRSLFGFASARAVLGLGEAANFPASIKTVAEWFPVKDRALVTGIFNSGSSIGAIIAPVIVTAITLFMGWKWAFIVTGALGFVWIVFWLIFYDTPAKHKKINEQERRYILQDKQTGAGEVIGWGKLLRLRTTYAICMTRVTTDWVWWFFLYWAPDFLNKTQGVDLKGSVLPLIVIYGMAGLGGILGGGISSALIRSNRSVDYSRKTAILICGLLAVPLFFAASTNSLWVAIALIGLAGAGHSGFASNIFTVISDLYPKNAVATMTGISGFAGAMGGALAASFVGLVLEITGSYMIVFACASSMYLLAWAILRFFVPVIKPLNFSNQNPA
ncbi:MAG: MFS transporter, partial [Cyclobacteriaceae bacterium]